MPVVVGSTSLVGALRHWRAGNIYVHSSIVFGLISMAGAYAGGLLSRFVPGATQLTIFGAVMFAAAISMLRSGSQEEPQPRDTRPAALPLAAAGVGVGMLTGLVGVGGGFLIVPAPGWPR